MSRPKHSRRTLLGAAAGGAAGLALAPFDSLDAAVSGSRHDAEAGPLSGAAPAPRPVAAEIVKLGVASYSLRRFPRDYVIDALNRQLLVGRVEL